MRQHTPRPDRPASQLPQTPKETDMGRVFATNASLILPYYEMAQATTARIMHACDRTTKKGQNDYEVYSALSTTISQAITDINSAVDGQKGPRPAMLTGPPGSGPWHGRTWPSHVHWVFPMGTFGGSYSPPQPVANFTTPIATNKTSFPPGDEYLQFKAGPWLLPPGRASAWLVIIPLMSNTKPSRPWRDHLGQSYDLTNAKLRYLRHTSRNAIREFFNLAMEEGPDFMCDFVERLGFHVVKNPTSQSLQESTI